MFGGMDEFGELQNDLWLVSPHFEGNRAFIGRTEGHYLDQPRLAVVV